MCFRKIGLRRQSNFEMRARGIRISRQKQRLSQPDMRRCIVRMASHKLPGTR